MTKNNTLLHYILFACIIAFALAVRVYHIDTVPSGIYPDEANNGTNAFDAYTNHTYAWFYPDNNGREGLFINSIALCFALFGVSMFTFKLTSIAMGVCTVIGVYLLCRELFISQPRIALIAAYLTAVSFWAINFSRIAFRAIMMLPILTLLFYFLLRGIRTKKWYHFAIAGMLCGAGFHTYIAFRIIPALLTVFFVLLLIQHGTDIYKSIWKYLIIFVLCAGVTIAPLLYTFHTHPEFLTARTGDVSVFAQKDTPLTQTLAHTVTQSLTKYHLSGDNNWRHNYPPYPIIEPIVGIWFLCGFLFSIGIFVSFAVRRFRHGNRNRKLLTHGLLIAWFFAFLAPEFMTTEGLPHCLRAIGTLPVVYIFAAYMINFVAERMQKKSPLLSYGTTIFLCIMFVWIGFFNITKYHIHWAHEHEQAAAFNKDLTDIARHIRTLPETETTYVVAGGLERLPIQLLTTDIPNIRYFYENEADMIPTDTPFLLFLPYYNNTVITTVTQKTSADIIEAHTDLGTSFFIIKSH